MNLLPVIARSPAKLTSVVCFPIILEGFSDPPWKRTEDYEHLREDYSVKFSYFSSTLTVRSEVLMCEFCPIWTSTLQSLVQSVV